MLKILIYAYMNRIYSSRQIAQACHRDINFMYLLEDMPAPDHATIARFRSLHFAPCAKVIMSRLNQILADNGELSLRHSFIDGTKIEAAANKYTFVWKKAVPRNQQKLADMVPELFREEGAFREVKSNMDFKRFLCRGHKNILAESILAGIAPNVNKLHSKIQWDCCGEHLHTIKAA